MYFQAYELFQSFLYGAEPLTSHMEMVLTVLASAAAIAVIAAPFWLVYKCLNFIFGVF